MNSSFQFNLFFYNTKSCVEKVNLVRSVKVLAPVQHAGHNSGFSNAMVKIETGVHVLADGNQVLTSQDLRFIRRKVAPSRRVTRLPELPWTRGEPTLHTFPYKTYGKYRDQYREDFPTKRFGFLCTVCTADSNHFFTCSKRIILGTFFTVQCFV